MRKQWLTVILVLSLPGCNRHNTSGGKIDPINDEMANKVAAICQDLKNGDADKAIPALESIRKNENVNGMTAYLLAAAYGKKKDWNSASKWLKTGNDSTQCALYVGASLVDRQFSAYSILRDFTNNCVEASTTLGPDTGGALLLDCRRMAKILASSEPRCLIVVLVSAAVRKISDNGLIKLYETAKMAKEAKTAQAFEHADGAWSNQLKLESRKLLENNSMENSFNKHFTPQELETMKSGNIPDALKKRVDAAMQEALSLEIPIANRAASTMPD